MAEHCDIKEVIDAFSRVRVRQGDEDSVLQLVARQADRLAGGEKSTAMVALEIKNRALGLRRISRSIPRFVIEDLLEEAIAKLHKQAAKDR